MSMDQYGDQEKYTKNNSDHQNGPTTQSAPTIASVQSYHEQASCQGQGEKRSGNSQSSQCQAHASHTYVTDENQPPAPA